MAYKAVLTLQRSIASRLRGARDKPAKELRCDVRAAEKGRDGRADAIFFSGIL
jgi:hypothetical protein